MSSSHSKTVFILLDLRPLHTLEQEKIIFPRNPESWEVEKQKVEKLRSEKFRSVIKKPKNLL